MTSRKQFLYVDVLKQQQFPVHLVNVAEWQDAEKMCDYRARRHGSRKWQYLVVIQLLLYMEEKSSPIVGEYIFDNLPKKKPLSQSASFDSASKSSEIKKIFDKVSKSGSKKNFPGSEPF